MMESGCALVLTMWILVMCERHPAAARHAVMRKMIVGENRCDFILLDLCHLIQSLGSQRLSSLPPSPSLKIALLRSSDHARSRRSRAITRLLTGATLFTQSHRWLNSASLSMSLLFNDARAQNHAAAVVMKFQGKNQNI